jgi:hypothetical protein
MQQEEAVNLLTELMGSDTQLKEIKSSSNRVSTFNFHSLKFSGNQHESTPDSNFIDIDKKTNKLAAIGFQGKSLLKIFDIEKMVFDDFSQQLMQRYNIKELKNLNSVNPNVVKYGITIDNQKLILGHDIRDKTRIFLFLETIQQAAF